MSFHQFESTGNEGFGSFETFLVNLIEVNCGCGFFRCPQTAIDDSGICADCGKEQWTRCTGTRKWFWWACFPGCFPDGDPSGPFDTEDEAITNANEV